eukprot:8473846-Alexandrium_andersonii.AAC.1
MSPLRVCRHGGRCSSFSNWAGCLGFCVVVFSGGVRRRSVSLSWPVHEQIWARALVPGCVARRARRASSERWRAAGA